MPFRHLAHLVFGPGRYRPVMVPVEGAVIKPLRLQKHHGVGVFDGCDQQPLGIIRIGRDHHLQPADMGEEGFRALAVRLPAKNPAAGGHAENDRAGEIAIERYRIRAASWVIWS